MRPDAVPTRAPATRDQADAYRFGLRRLESALVRGDAVPLHEQVRSQRRAALTGVVLGVLAVAAVAVYALLVPEPDWRSRSVVLASGSGAMYVVADGSRLVPVANLPAARLVLAALRAGGASTADPATARPVVIADAVLAGAPRTAAADVAGAAGVRLDGAVVPPAWAVCDEPGEDDPRTVVVGGAAPPAGGPPGAALVAVRGGGTWLLSGGLRHRVDPDDRPALVAFGLTGATPRPASAALVNAVAEGAPLRTPRVPGSGGPAPDGVPGRVGDVLVGGTGGSDAAVPPRHWVVLGGGLQEVPGTLAGALRAAGAAEHAIGPEVVARSADAAALDVAGWPAAVPDLPAPADAPVVCWTWTAGGDAAGSVLVTTGLPVPAGAAPVDLAQAGGGGADAVVLAPGGGGAVRAAAPGRPPGAGPLWLVSGSGAAHGVVDADTAAALGVTAAEPAPEAALRLLPVGPALDVRQVVRTVDVLPAG